MYPVNEHKRKYFFAFLTLFLAASAVLCLAAEGMDDEYRVIEKQMAEFRSDATAAARLRAETLNDAALIADTDRDPADVAVRRAQALLHCLQAMENPPDLSEETDALNTLAEQIQKGPPEAPGRRELFNAVLSVRRRIAFGNPLLDFDAILFLLHDRARFEHMVDQYYGFHAVRGGGVFILEQPFGPNPSVRNILAEATVENGRLQGKKLENGSFIALELDFDAQAMLFAWSEAEVPVPPTDRTPHDDLWTPGSTYHIFRASVDGLHLTQLTDGCWNDFDPCWLPDGRICFISERRGGYLRCGVRPNPTYTLHAMNADGSTITRLSHHETHEWHPSVNHDGMIVYTRWDYVDRDSDMAHHLWITYPDGRDPRTSHGNYAPVRELRPWMEMAIRAVPNSSRYVAVTTPHHGQNYGSMVLIDPALPDDGAMAQIKRITPEVAFPESEVRPGVPCETHKGRNNRTSEIHGTPWPLSELFYLCVYDNGQKNYGLYLVDAFGNRELLYQNPTMACLDPIPLKARPRPPVIPSTLPQHGQGGRLLITNIYDSDFTWPEGTHIAALRVIQIFPKTTPASTEPNIGIGAQSLARGVLGTAPVEEDGSVYCEVPEGVPIYFQALDDKGRAVQSMLSDTYLHPGETLSCRGCHESKQSAPKPANVTPLALRRAPSRLNPEPEGAYPVLFPQLVQPVLDRHCAECHAREKKAPSLSAAPSGTWGWSQAYQTLSGFAWAQHGGNGALAINGSPRSVAGKVGAGASALMKMLDGGHHGLRLPEEDLHRLVLWLDCNSVFYGAYHDLEKQARGQRVPPDLQ